MRILGTNLGIVELLIAINVLVFMFTIPDLNLFIQNFGLKPVSIFDQPWTLLTSMFLHAGFNHLIFNMIGMFFFGSYLYRLVGEREFMKIYFLGGIIAGLSYLSTSFLFNIPPPNIPAVGASGAIFAVMGTLVVLKPRLTILLNFFIPMPLYVWAILYTVIAVTQMLGTMGGVAHNAHLGGLVAGLFFGYYLKKKISAQPTHRYGYRFY